nr:MAG TPA: hypothetical protein [Caudoviricetes sp.]
MKIEQILCLVMAELERAEKIHPAWPADLVKASAILAEEAGETLRATNTFDETRSGKKEIITEAVQTAAMAIRLLKNINQEGAENE